MSDPQHHENIKRIKQEVGCSDEIAVEALNQNNDINQAIMIAHYLKSQAKNQDFRNIAQPTQKIIQQYNNGLLIDGTFYDFKKRENLEMLNRLRKGEIDANILKGKSGEYVQISVHILNKDYVAEDAKIEKKAPIVKEEFVKKVDCPSSLDLDIDGEIVFKVFTGDMRITMKSRKGRKIKEVMNKIKEYTSKEFVIKNNEKVLREEELVDEISNTLVTMYYQ